MAQGRRRAVAVVGMGPRGLGALEALAAAIARRAPTQPGEVGVEVGVEVFDPLPWPGAGPNFSPEQSPLCRLNIPLRAVGGRLDEAGAFPALDEWLAREGGRDPAGDPTGDSEGGEPYPARAELGRWLMARAEALAEALPGLVHHRLQAEALDPDPAGGWRIRAGGRVFGPFDEVLLTQGQPATEPDPQIRRWQDHARKTGADLVPAYPDHALLARAAGWAGRAVGIRGLGLSTLDVVRLLTLGMGGRFADGRYHPSGREPARIIPFSLDGLPPWPKPADAAIEARLSPLPEETAAFVAAISAAVAEPPGPALARLSGALVAPVLRLLAEAGRPASREAVEGWLAAEREAPGSQGPSDPVTVLREGIAMARGEAPPDIGYAGGHVWRAWQNDLRRGFNPCPPPPATAAAILGLDEGLKRYSYGPPVATLAELLMLVEAGRVDLRAAADPDILPVPGGWQLHEEDVSARVEAMVDAVLPAPAVERLSDPLLRGLREAGRIVARGEGLGARVLPDGQALGRRGGRDGVERGLSVLGRMALGSVIAVDSVHDCFGAAARRWAEGVLERAEG